MNPSAQSMPVSFSSHMDLIMQESLKNTILYFFTGFNV